VAPCAFAAARDITGRLLLVRRCDTGDWELPGGHVDPGESAAGAAVRETAEESGITVQVTGLAGIYTDPGHVIADPRDGLVRQPFAVCFHARPLSGSPGGDQVETSDARWFTLRRHPRPADPPGHAPADRPRADPRPSLPHRLTPAIPRPAAPPAARLLVGPEAGWPGAAQDHLPDSPPCSRPRRPGDPQGPGHGG
jgi:8-oxo-dGTP pyrophosphatase MutT (NUDIX family)